MMKKFILLLLIYTCALLTTSCWSRREIDELGFVLGIGISKTEKELYSVVVQLANPSAIVAEGSPSREVYSMISSEGLTVFDALRNISKISARRLYFSHLKALVIDESVAKEGLTEIVGFLVQDMEVRLESQVFIGRQEDVALLLDTPNTLGQIPAMVLSIAADNYGANSKIYVSDLHHTVEVVNNPVHNYTTASIITEASPTEYEKPPLKLTSIAIFDHDKLKGYLDYEEGQGFNFITNNFKNALIIFERKNKEKITIEVLESKATITPKFDHEKVSFDIQLKVKGNIAERSSMEDGMATFEITDIQSQLDQVLADKLQKSITTAQEKFKIDYFNLSKDFSRKYPQEFKVLKSDWNKVFSKADIHVTVKSTVIHSALNTNRGRI